MKSHPRPQHKKKKIYRKEKSSTIKKELISKLYRTQKLTKYWNTRRRLSKPTVDAPLTILYEAGLGDPLTTFGGLVSDGFGSVAMALTKAFCLILGKNQRLLDLLFQAAEEYCDVRYRGSTPQWTSWAAASMAEIFQPKIKIPLRVCECMECYR